jgi:hypothetical protein
MGEFNAQLEEALKQERLIKESRKPSSGLWYYVYFAPSWKREVFLATAHGSIGHDIAWKDYVVPELMKHYKIADRDQERALVSAYRGMPRGRVDMSASSNEFRMAGEKPNAWYLFHGDDFPKGLIAESEKSLLVSDFHLTNFAVRDLVEFKFARHETMLPEHKEIVQKIIGHVPY